MLLSRNPLTQENEWYPVMSSIIIPHTLFVGPDLAVPPSSTYPQTYVLSIVTTIYIVYKL